MDSWLIQRDGVVTSAIVVRTDHERMKHSNSYTNIPVLMFEIAGQSVVRRSSSGSVNKKYEDGTPVQICYKRDNPDKILILGDYTRRNIALFFVAMGLVLTVIGLVIDHLFL